MTRTFDILKIIFERNGLEIIDVNEYSTQPDFKKEFDKLTEGRKVSIAFISNKFNKVNKVLIKDDKF